MSDQVGAEHWLWIVLAILASYRVSRMLAVEEGPLGLFDAVRVRLDPAQKTWLGRGVNCPLCIGFYVSLGVVVLLLPFLSWQTLILEWLGVAGGMAVLHLWLEARE